MTTGLRPIRQRWLQAMTTSAAMAVALVLLLGFRWHQDRQSLLDDIVVQADLIGGIVGAALVFNDETAAREIIATLTRSPDVLEVAVYRADGTRLAHAGRNGVASGLEPMAPPPGHRFSFGELALTAPVVSNDRSVGRIALRAKQSRVYRELAHFFLGVLVIGGSAALVGYFANRRVRRQISDAERALEEMALADRVSKLPNRHAFELALDIAVRRHQREGGGSSVLFIDLDGFKKVNDLFGHHRGDRLLEEVGVRLRGALRGADVIARIGGDEFAAILTDTAAPEDAARVADNLIRVGALPFDVGGAPVFIGFSIGIAMIPRDGTDVEILMQRADLAMYQAKQAGKGCHLFFSEDIGALVKRRLELEAALREAIDGGQLYVVYQPQVRAHGGELAGLEALVRWRHPLRGVVSPGEFIPVAEESGMIIDIGRVVLGQVCDSIAGLRREGYTVPRVAVNVSSRQLMLGNLVDELPAMLAVAGLTAADIELELTESVLMDRVEGQRNTLDELSEMNFKLAIDDFGTGYSSLNYLRHLPVDTLKIDMSFIRSLPEDQESRAIVTGIIGMAHAIGLEVVAEGVETAAQLDCLQQLGCDLIQGYHTGRPLELHQLKARLTRSHCD